ncbi:MAG: hypothetical protein RMN51_12305, partial [Verrucomicrobiota bacterium]|nr:hypothetical protein [Verrucomicrobiota bacterium]
HAAFVLDEEFFAAFGVEEAAAVAGFEVFGGEDFVGEEVEGEGFDEDGAEGFDEVEGEGPASVVGCVEGTEGWVESVGVAGGGGFVVEEGSGEGDAGVDGVEGWSCGSAFEGEFGWKEGGPGLVVFGCSESFEAAEFLEVLGGADGCKKGVEFVNGSGDESCNGFGCGFVWGLAIGEEALEDAALVVEFSGNGASGDGKGESGVEDALVLAESGEAVGLGVG